MTKIDPTLKKFLDLLHRGGSWSYWWHKTNSFGNEWNKTTWWLVGKPASIPQGNTNIYFGVHPTGQQGDYRQRATKETVTAINCLFAEFDQKDGATIETVNALDPEPSTIIDSGGGWHCYWILTEPYHLATEQDRERAIKLQKAWATTMGGDPGAQDLARVLRVPGTLNYKYDPPRPVQFYKVDFTRLFRLDDLEALIPMENIPAHAVKVQAGNSYQYSTDSGAFWLEKALERANLGNRNETGFWLACQLRDNGLPMGEALSLSYPERVPQTSGNAYIRYEWETSVKEAYKSTPRDPAKSKTIAINNNGYRPAQELQEEPQAPAIPTQGSFTDDANAIRFTRRNGDRLKWVNEWGWMNWTGKRWELDQSEQVMKLARATARNIYREAAEAEEEERVKAIAAWAGKSLNRTRLEAMIAVSKSDLSVRPADFDLDPWALNVNNGTIDLRTGDLKPHDRQAMITKLVTVDYNPEAECPIWDAFLERIFDGDRDLITFIQKAVGYSLAGDTSEQVFFFLYGLGANGKSTFANVIHDLLSEYSMKARAEVIMQRRFDVIPEETAQMAGVRFLLAAELGEGQRLNEPLIKDLTGGDKLRARLLYHKSFEFYPTAKVWLYGNHKPMIYGNDEGIWRRPKLIPFSVTIPENEQDKKLPDKLRAELTGILAWAVRGCLLWQMGGLKPPARVNAATAEFRAEQDIIGQFIDDRCTISKLATVTAGELYDAYKSWCEKNGQEPKSNIVFGRQLEERGYSTRGADGKKQRQPGSGRAYYTGIGLREEDKE